MSTSETVWRSMHDVGLAAWFGGGLTSLASTQAGADGADPRNNGSNAPAQAEHDSAMWGQLGPAVMAGIAAHLVGGAGLIVWNKGRITAQQGAPTATAVKTALTGVALGLTAMAARDGMQLDRLRRSGDHPKRRRRLETRMRVWTAALPVTTGSMIILGAVHGEQQRPREMAKGVAGRALGSVQHVLGGVAGAAGGLTEAAGGLGEQVVSQVRSRMNGHSNPVAHVAEALTP